MKNNEKLPPQNRSPLWQEITRAAHSGEFVLPVCEKCETVQYPPREICSNCLNHELSWKNVAASGQLISFTALHASTEAFFRDHTPWQIALVKLDCGPVVYAHRSAALKHSGERVRLLNKVDKSGQGVFIAIPETADETECLNEFSALLT